MTYTTSYFRANMWEILDKTKYNREYTTIGRRWKKEFYIVSAELWEEKNIWKNFSNECVIEEIEWSEEFIWTKQHKELLSLMKSA